MIDIFQPISSFKHLFLMLAISDWNKLSIVDFVDSFIPVDFFCLYIFGLFKFFYFEFVSVDLSIIILFEGFKFIIIIFEC